MIKAILMHEDDRYIVSIEGHANYADHGEDIVCAGVSTLAQAFVFYVTDLGERYIDHLQIEEPTGRLIFLCHGPEHQIMPAFLMLKVGLEAIQENFPQNLYLSGGKSEKPL